MTRVIGRCNTLGECCQRDNPSQKVDSVEDDTEADVMAELSITDLSGVFENRLGGFNNDGGDW